MALSNSEYNFIMREYEERRYKAHRELTLRTKEVYNQIPRIKEIQNEISSSALENVKKRLLGNNEGISTKEELHQKITSLIKEKSDLLSDYGYDDNYLNVTYVCNECKDTGYIGNEKCFCLKEKITELLYSQSNIKEILERENFENFNLSLYSDNFVDTVTNVNSADNIRKVLNVCQNFTTNFGKEFENLLIYGATGVGKTFLTNCIAKEIMDKTYSVIYVSAIRLFEMLANEQFGKNENGYNSSVKDFINCDLLIIDDLGTELVNSFTSSALFNCINERFLKRKSIIISTNLSLGEIRNIYSERVFSRVTSNYTLLKVFGEDLRIVTSLGLTKV